MLFQVRSYSVVKVHGAFLSPKSLNEPLSVHLFTRLVYIFAVKSQLISDNFPEFFLVGGGVSQRGHFSAKEKQRFVIKTAVFPNDSTKGGFNEQITNLDKQRATESK